MARRLIKLEIDRVDLVDKGANQKASIVLAKRQVKKDGPSVGDVHVDTMDCKCADCNMAKEKSVPQKSLLKGLYELLKGSGVEGLEEPKEPEAVAVKVSDDPVIQKRFTDLEKKNADLEASLKASGEAVKAEVNKRLDSEMRDFLKSFKATPFNVDEAKEDNDIKKFRKMQDADPDGFKRVMEMMKAQDASLATSKAFETIGKNGASAGSAEAQLVAKAVELRKNDTKLTEEAAFAAACEANPRLTREYRAEQN